uniref:Pseudouridine synthase I TruA alpha/beta domain-containing protein n=1 Tax=Oryza meridionalis TaxID=40149 RepID=A0A0E0CPK2_9ORYZ
MAAASPPASPPHPKRPKMSSSSDPDQEPTSPSAAGADGAQPRAPRYKRRKVAILLGYCGAGYQGMQKNPGARTIEGDLEEALYRAGAVPEADRAAPRRYDWARAARTDKGVSAAAQVVSGRFYVDPPVFTDRLNAQLAPQIRAFGYVRVTNSFNAKKFCDRRRYVYLLPVFALDPSAHPDREAVMASVGSGSELTKCLECSERGRKVPGVMGREGKVPDPVLQEEKSVESSREEAAVDSNEDENCDPVSTGDRSVDLPIPDNETNSQITEMRSNGAEKCDVQLSGGTLCSEAVPASISETVCPILNSDSNTNSDSIDVDPSFVAEKKGSIETVVTEDGKEQAMDVVTEDEKKQDVDYEGSSLEEMPLRSAFSYTHEVKERFNRILKKYVGTHNFHNFTTRTKAEDPAAKRFIISFAADRVVNLDGIDFIRCEVVGQSFMLHQIRKMIGLAVAVMRNCAPESIYDVAFRKDVNLNVPTAPEVGLYLDECMFTSYNKKWKDSHEAVSMEPYSEEAEEFKLKYIFPHIAAMEHKEGAVALWLHSLNSRNYPDFRYMDNAGTEASIAAAVESVDEGTLPSDNISE